METAVGPFAKYVVSLMHCQLSTPLRAYSRDVVIFHGLELPFKGKQFVSVVGYIFCAG